ncbi:hypothetical protein QYZ88_018950 (plasmid) [Lachnospiraceae bacterium C1.1]|nr:hypothetical protein [Lachnospiraceae bacterium C1.1]
MTEIFSTSNIIEALAYALIGPVVLILIGLVIHYLDLILTGAIARATNSTIAFIFRNYLTYFGTVHHELAHALFAFVTGAKVLRINLIPRGTKLGSVEFETRGNIFFKSIQLSLSAIAPVIFGAVSMFIMIYAILPKCSLAWHYILFVYIFISIFFHMTMSTQDINNFLKGFPICLLILFVIFLFIKPDFYAIFDNIRSVLS